MSKDYHLILRIQNLINELGLRKNENGIYELPRDKAKVWREKNNLKAQIAYDNKTVVYASKNSKEPMLTITLLN